MSTTTIVIIVVAAVVLIALLLVATIVLRQRKDRRDVREHFGPEYDRLEQERDENAAVDELKDRQQRVDQFDVRELDPSRREHFQRQWRAVQLEFVEEPSSAIARGDALIQDVMRERGYPVEDFEQRAADLSVDHPEVVQHYRQGHQLASRNRAGEATTEQLREGFVHYRELFARLVGQPADEDAVADPLRQEVATDHSDPRTDRNEDE